MLGPVIQQSRERKRVFIPFSLSLPLSWLLFGQSDAKKARIVLTTVENCFFLRVTDALDGQEKKGRTNKTLYTANAGISGAVGNTVKDEDNFAIRDEIEYLGLKMDNLMLAFSSKSRAEKTAVSYKLFLQCNDFFGADCKTI